MSQPMPFRRFAQWLEDLPSDEARQQLFDQVMSFFADGTIQPPHASKSAIVQHSMFLQPC